MCGIAGFFNCKASFMQQEGFNRDLLKSMASVLSRRGPDDRGIYLSDSFALAHSRLSVIDLTFGHQPMLKQVNGYTYGIVYNGEVYNTKELKDDLIQKNYIFQTTSDTEVLLTGYIEYGADFVRKVNGIFAFAVMDQRLGLLTLFRDRLGVKPLFYTMADDTIVFSSEIKGLFQYPGIKAQLDKQGLNEVFGIGPARSNGCGVFKNINELLPGCILRADGYGIKQTPYWSLKSAPHEDTYEQTVEKTAWLVQDAIQRQMVSDVPICTFLSGGLDSSLVSAVCAKKLKKEGRQLNTFSFDFVNNDRYFQSNAFQPSRDRPYVDLMVRHIQSEHRYLECSNLQMAEGLYASVDARDLPAMADIDSSLLYFCSQVKPFNKVALTGECADEIFGGYPWFHKEEFFNAGTFPWTPDLTPRKNVLSDDFLAELDMDAYVQKAYCESLDEVPRLKGEPPKEARRREISYLNLKWFMQTLLDRMDRTSMYSGLEARVPFADHRIVEYVWNVPWEMKTPGGLVKGLLRDSAKGLLPDEVLYRKKSPYPKTYDPGYEKLLAARLIEIIEDSSSPINQFLDKKKIYSLMGSPSDYGKPWFGQLMSGPQMMAYLIQVNYWMRKYRIERV